jgi:O-Antigen ligase
VSITFIAFIYISVAITLGGGLAWFTFSDCRSDVFRIVCGWLILTAIPFFVSIPSLCFILMGVVLYALKPKHDKDQLVFYYMALLPALPMVIVWKLTFPFVSSLRLFHFHYLDLINLIYILPLAFAAAPRTQGPLEPNFAFAIKIGKLSFYVLLYMLFLDFRETSVTDGVRKFVHNALSLLVIVMAFRNLTCSKHTIDKAFKGMLVAGCMMFAIALFQHLKLWKFYTALPYAVTSFDAIYLATEVRGGSVRAPSTMYPLPFGLYMAICIGIMSSFVARRDYGFFSLAALGAYFFGLGLSGSRGGILGLMVMLGIMMLYSDRFTALRQVMYKMRWVVVCLLIVGIGTLINLDELSQMDEHGTFQYRIELIQNSMVVFRENILFGSSAFRLHPALEASRQGQGIIDITNALLGILLNYGMVGLIGFLTVFYMLIRRMIKERAIAEQEKIPKLEYEFRMLIAILLGYILVIITVSFVDRIAQYYWIFIALGAALVKNKQQYESRSSDT